MKMNEEFKKLISLFMGIPELLENLVGLEYSVDRDDYSSHSDIIERVSLVYEVQTTIDHEEKEIGKNER